MSNNVIAVKSGFLANDVTGRTVEVNGEKRRIINGTIVIGNDSNEKPIYLEFSSWNKEGIEPYLLKGRLVELEGYFRPRMFRVLGSDGNLYNKWLSEFVVNSIKPLGAVPKDRIEDVNIRKELIKAGLETSTYKEDESKTKKKPTPKKGTSLKAKKKPAVKKGTLKIEV